jgi:GxxExxY protein
MEDIAMDENSIAKEVVDSAYSVHRELGPGLLESVYELALCHELESRKLEYSRQHKIQIVYKDMLIMDAFRADILVGKKLIIELKSIEAVSPVHKKQLITYLKLADCKLGLLINFGSHLIKDGITRVVNKL